VPVSDNIKPYWSLPGVKLYLGDAQECLRRMPARSVHCCVTSPPYWKQVDYGERDQLGMEEGLDCCGWATKEPCRGCYTCRIVAAFTEVRRVLRDDGTLWLNLGDTIDGEQQMVPSRIALAMQASGWLLRQDIIWYAPNKLPEPVSDRCVKSHEHIFLMAKQSGYYFDATAIMVDGSGSSGGSTWSKPGGAQHRAYDRPKYETVNKRDVWTVGKANYPGAHFATFNPALIEPCILAGTSECGCCMECGRQYERVITRTDAVKVNGDIEGRHRNRSLRDSRNGRDSTLDTGIANRETVGWRQVCGCCTSTTIPCTVLDPFVGSGTTVATSILLGRAGVGIDLSEVYLRDHAVPRVEAAMRGERTVRSALPIITAGDTPKPKRMR
jgi:DNA modification methylase